MQFTIDKTNENIPTYEELFSYLKENLSNHYLLESYEREECSKSIEKLQRVFSRFYNKRY